jgi:bifunctional ADP-heptose synthase (sugar kinase/adenylyltransferase)
LTVVGEDWRGHLWTVLNQERGINISHTLVDPSRWTPAYGKPIKIGISGEEFEEPRLDFTNRVPLPEPLEEEMCQRIRKLGQEADAVIVSDQWANGTVTPTIREVINNLGHTRPVYVDSRTAMREYFNAVLKPNEWEFAEAIGCSFLDIRMMQEREIVQLARGLIDNVRGPLCLTRADRGVMWIDSTRVYTVSAPEVSPPIDPVGAGDAFLTAFCACRTAGGEITEALLFGSLASSIVLRKIGTTGNAKPDEMRQEFRRYYKDSGRGSFVHEGIHSV